MRAQRIAAEYTRPVRHRPQRVAGFNEAAANRCGIRLRSDRRRGPGQAASMRPQRIAAEYMPNDSPNSNSTEICFNEAAANRCGIRRQAESYADASARLQ